MRTHVKSAGVNEIEAMYERPQVKVKVERDHPFNVFHSFFIYARKIYVRTHAITTRQWKSTLVIAYKLAIVSVGSTKPQLTLEDN